MSELKPCPFCGNNMDDYTMSFKRDRKKVLGVYHEICTIKCHGCTCSISQAGVDRERAVVHAFEMWNRRVNANERGFTQVYPVRARAVLHMESNFSESDFKGVYGMVEQEDYDPCEYCHERGWDYYYDDDGDLMMRCSECEHWDE